MAKKTIKKDAPWYRRWPDLEKGEQQGPFIRGSFLMYSTSSTKRIALPEADPCDATT